MNGAHDFSEALFALKQGNRINRVGWNGSGQYVYLVQAGRYAPTTEAGRHIASSQRDDRVPYRAYMALCTVQGDVVPWTPSQSDTLADDWEIHA